MLEVYVDDSIQLAQTSDPVKLRHLSRALMHGIHGAFLPLAISGHNGKSQSWSRNLRKERGYGKSKRKYWDRSWMAPPAAAGREKAGGYSDGLKNSAPH